MSVPLTGQVAITTSAQPLAATSVATTTAFTIKAPSANSNPVYLGGAGVTTLTGYQMDPGDEFEYQQNDQHGQPSFQLRVSDFYAVGTAGDKLSWLASQ